MVEGPEAGLKRVSEIAKDERLKGHYRVDAVRAHLYERAGRRDLAIEHYRRAADGDREPAREKLPSSARPCAPDCTGTDSPAPASTASRTG